LNNRNRSNDLNLIICLFADVEPSSILENRFPKELPPAYATQASQPPTKEDSPAAAVVSGMLLGFAFTFYIIWYIERFWLYRCSRSQPPCPISFL
jgi:hypothetical protein